MLYYGYFAKSPILMIVTRRTGNPMGISTSQQWALNNFFIFKRAEEVYLEFLKTKTGTVAGSENWSWANIMYCIYSIHILHIDLFVYLHICIDS